MKEEKIGESQALNNKVHDKQFGLNNELPRIRPKELPGLIHIITAKAEKNDAKDPLQIGHVGCYYFDPLYKVSRESSNEQRKGLS